MLRCSMSIMDISGYDGGIDELLARTHKPKIGPWSSKAMDMGVLHAGNGYSGFNQFRPKGS